MLEENEELAWLKSFLERVFPEVVALSEDEKIYAMSELRSWSGLAESLPKRSEMTADFGASRESLLRVATLLYVEMCTFQRLSMIKRLVSKLRVLLTAVLVAIAEEISYK